MQKYKYIRSKDDMLRSLHNLWDNEELYTFLKGKDYIDKVEIEITECMTNEDRKMFLILAKFDYMLK